jgi:hypothetical protein
VQAFQQIFPFLHLPGELRNEIYKHALGDFEGVAKVFEAAYKSLTSREPNEKPEPYQTPAKVPPTILLINKQVYHEAVYFLQHKSITFDHGLLHVSDVLSVISPHILRNLSSITINDTAHPIMQDEIQCASWHGYNRLLKQLTNILKDGHRLKQFTIDFTDPELVHHVKACAWNSGSNCDFAKHLAKEMGRMSQVRGVVNVTLRGLNPKLSAKLKTRMESRKLTFFDLPDNIRKIIYSHAADWNDASRAFKRVLTGWRDADKAVHTPRRSTPTILLLNRQVTSDALKILHEKAFTVTIPNDWRFSISGLTPFDLLASCITTPTLRTVKNLHITIEHWGPLIASDGDFLTPFAHPSSKLQHLRMNFIDRFVPRMKHNAADVHRFHLSPFASVRGLEEVVIEGDLPLVIADQIGRVMTSLPTVGEKLPRAFWPVASKGPQCSAVV